jgi:hypothetical protein
MLSFSDGISIHDFQNTVLHYDKIINLTLVFHCFGPMHINKRQSCKVTMADACMLGPVHSPSFLLHEGSVV